jgi:hypothetical protein
MEHPAQTGSVGAWECFTLDEAVRMPRSIKGKVNRALKDHPEELENLRAACRDKPQAPDFEGLEHFTNKILGKVTCVADIKRKCVLLQVALRMFKHRTYSRAGVIPYANKAGCYLVQLPCVCNRSLKKKSEADAATCFDLSKNSSSVSVDTRPDSHEHTVKSEGDSAEPTQSTCTQCGFQVSFLFEFDSLNNCFSCKIIRRSSHLLHGHEYERAWDNDLKKLRTEMRTEATFLVASTFSTSKASEFANGGNMSGAQKRSISRNLAERYSYENERSTIESFFRHNGFEYELTDDYVVWSSPQMQNNVAEYLDPFHFDGTHGIPVLGRQKNEGLPKGNLYNFVSPSREGRVSVLAQALTFPKCARYHASNHRVCGESETTSTKAG